MANNINKIQVQGTTYDLRDPALSVVNGIVKCDGAGVLAAAVEGTDYQAPLSATQMLWYGECSTGQSTVAKTATIAGLTEIKTGLHVAIKFTSAQRATNPTLNINQLGAYPMKIYGTTAVAGWEWIAGSLIEFVFDGTNWIIVDGRRATTSYYGVTKLATSATSTSTSTALTPASLNNFWLSCISPFPTLLTTQAYAVDDYVRYNYNVYRCKTATAAGAWASISANFDEMPTIWELIQDVSSDVDGKADLTALNSKADLTALNAKADLTALNSKADLTALNAKADLTALNSKADLTALNSKADLTAVNGKADWNMLNIASPTVASNAFALSSDIGVYRVTATITSGSARIPTPSTNNIPARSAYFCFDMEVAIGSSATSIVGPANWAWVEEGELPTTNFAGKTLYMSVRFDCQAQTFLANVWRIA